MSAARMKKISAKILLLMCAATASAAGRDVYVSSSEGDDSNDGSANAPLRTIAAVPRENVNLFLKRGDVFYETLSNFKNSKIGAYGEGAKPKLCGFKILKNKGAWKRAGDGLWELDLTVDADFAGYKGDKRQKNSARIANNIGAIYDAKNDRLYGVLAKEKSGIKNDGDFWVSDGKPRPNGLPKNDAFTKLYFKWGKNPSESFDAPAFMTHSFGIRAARNCEFENIAITGFGAHGVALAWNCKFRNLDIDLIGGSLLLTHPRWVRFGNGVEFWMSKDPCNGNLVENCSISRTYDCGATIQGYTSKDFRPRDIRFIGNRFLRCRQAFEHWTNPLDGTETVFENCEFSNNKCFDSGVSEFGTKGENNTAILSYERLPIKGLSIKNNVSWGAPVCYSSGGNVAEFRNNTFYVYKDSYLYFQPNPREKIPARGDADIAALKRKLGSDAGEIILADRADAAFREKVIDGHFADMKPAIKKFDAR